MITNDQGGTKHRNVDPIRADKTWHDNNSDIASMANALQFLIYPGPVTATFNVYDGTNAQCSVNGTVTTVAVSSVARPITLKIFEATSPAGVERNGVRLPHLTSQGSSGSAAIGWFYDSSAKFLYAKFQHNGGIATVGFGPNTIGDGVTDSWRSYYGVSDDTIDSDGDGLTNAQEYLAGTSPIDPTSLFTISSIAPQNGGGFAISWPSATAVIYRVEWKNALTDTTWNSVTPDFTGTGSLMNCTDDGSQTGGYHCNAFTASLFDNRRDVLLHVPRPNYSSHPQHNRLDLAERVAHYRRCDEVCPGRGHFAAILIWSRWFAASRFGARQSACC